MNKEMDEFNETNNAISTEGLRDFFAAAALQGLLSNPKLADEIKKQGSAFGGCIETSAWGWADAMMEKRDYK